MTNLWVIYDRGYIIEETWYREAVVVYRQCCKDDNATTKNAAPPVR
jgi:hypothetical protein